MPRRQQLKTRQQIADTLGMSPRVFRKWLKEQKIVLPPGVLTPATQKIIHRRFQAWKQAQRQRKMTDSDAPELS